MTLLTIASEVALNIGIDEPDAVAASTLREHKEIVEMTAEAARELARRVDWGDLTASTTLTGDGTAKQHDLASGHSRLAKGIAVVSSGGDVVRPTTRSEWAFLTPSEGDPRYFLLEDDTMRLWPYLASGDTVTVYYQTENWCSNGTAEWTADSETALVPEDLVAKLAIVRFRRLKGMEYSDHEAEYEAALRDYAEFDNGAL